MAIALEKLEFGKLCAFFLGWRNLACARGTAGLEWRLKKHKQISWEVLVPFEHRKQWNGESFEQITTSCRFVMAMPIFKATFSWWAACRFHVDSATWTNANIHFISFLKFAERNRLLAPFSPISPVCNVAVARRTKALSLYPIHKILQSKTLSIQKSWSSSNYERIWRSKESI